MNWKSALSYSALGISFGVVAVITKSYSMLDCLCNLSVPYFCTVVGIALLLVGLHCLLFNASVASLPLRPTVFLFVLLSVSVNGSIVWDGLFRDNTWSDILFNLANTGELTLLYAALLFLPRIAQPKDRQVFSEAAPSASSEKPSS
jgi:hypothetical protein